MKESGYYPEGAEFDPKAPWNEKESEEKEVEVTVSITLSKTVKVKVSDYEIIEAEDEDGRVYEDIDYSNCDLRSAVEEQIILPQDSYKYIAANTERGKRAYTDLKDWNVDDFECIIDE